MTIVPVWEQLAAYTVIYYVVDTIGDGSGTNGTLSASVERKGMDSYENSEFVSGNTVYDGSTATFTASPDNGYVVQEWQVDGEVQAGNTSNTLTLSASELTADTTVTVQFREIGDKVTISAEKMVKSPAPSQVVWTRLTTWKPVLPWTKARL